MASNTKLFLHEKAYLKELKQEAKLLGIKLANNGETTIAYSFKGTTVKFSTAVMSCGELKFRRKVGEYHALTRLMEYDNFVVLSKYDFESMLDVLEF